MNLKFDLTKYIAELENLPVDEKSIRQHIIHWWQNPRIKEKGGLKLTDEGFARFTRHIKAHQIKLDTQVEYTNQMILRLDNFITCPWYISKKDVWVFDDKMAVQLVLFSGNIAKFTSAKAKSLDRVAH